MKTKKYPIWKFYTAAWMHTLQRKSTNKNLWRADFIVGNLYSMILAINFGFPGGHNIVKVHCTMIKNMKYCNRISLQ